MVSQDTPIEPAPIGPPGLAAALAPFGQSRMLPPEAYTAEDVFEWEQRHFFEGGWTCVATASAISASGDQRAEQLGRGGVLLMRDREGRARAFVNACRHRGHELLACGAATVNRPIVACPYHAWSYRLDGRLRRAPDFDGEDHFDPLEFGLVELLLVEWHGLLFVDVSGDAGPFSEHVAGLEEIVAPYEPERLVTRGRHEYVVAANWKILAENYQECYHCPVIHPELCAASVPDSGANYHHPGEGAWVGGWQDLRDGFETMSLDGRSLGTQLRGLDSHRRRIVDYIAIFPNILISPHPDFLMTHMITPLGPNRTRVQCAWAFSPEDMEREGFDPSYAIDFWDITNRQDWAACESVQRGLASEHARPGLLSEEEEAVYQFVTMVARAYAGQPLTAGAALPAR